MFGSSISEQLWSITCSCDAVFQTQWLLFCIAMHGYSVTIPYLACIVGGTAVLLNPVARHKVLSHTCAHLPDVVGIVNTETHRWKYRSFQVDKSVANIAYRSRCWLIIYKTALINFVEKRVSKLNWKSTSTNPQNSRDLNKGVCTYNLNLATKAWTDDESWCGPAQNGVNLDF